MRCLPLVLLVALSGCAAAAQTRNSDHDLALVHVGGEEAVFVDMAHVQNPGKIAGFHILVVAKTGQPPVPGWRQMVIDCNDNEFTTLATSDVSDDGSVGPAKTLNANAYPVLGGRPEEAMAAAVCDKINLPVRAATIAEATKIGRARLAAAK